MTTKLVVGILYGVFNDIKISNKIIVAALFGIVILVFAVWKSPILQTGISKPTTTETVSAQNIMKSEKYTKDSDEDGVRDWEEVLLGLDPNNKDTNGDGVSDGEEVANARKVFKEKATGISTKASTTKTDMLTKEIFGAYIQSKQQGTYDKTAFDFIIAQAANYQFSERISSSYTLEDILTTTDISKERTVQYEKDIRNAIKPITKIREYELTTYGRAVQTGKAEEFTTLIKNASVYETISKSLLAVVVPKDVAQDHLDLVNSFSKFAKILTVMGNSTEDPLRSLIATRDFIEGEDAIKTAYAQIGIYFTIKEIDL